MFLIYDVTSLIIMKKSKCKFCNIFLFTNKDDKLDCCQQCKEYNECWYISCTNFKTENSNYCVDCICATLNCNNERIIDYCLNCTCTCYECNEPKTESGYCLICNKHTYKEKKMHGNNIYTKCGFHNKYHGPCGWACCENECEYGYWYCHDHRCTFTKCFNRVDFYGGKACNEHKFCKRKSQCVDCGKFLNTNTKKSYNIYEYDLYRCYDCIIDQKFIENVCIVDNCTNRKSISKKYCKNHLIWMPTDHTFYPQVIQNSIKTFMLINKRIEQRLKIPKFVLIEVFRLII